MDEKGTVDVCWWVDEKGTVDVCWWVDEKGTVDECWWVDEKGTVDVCWVDEKGTVDVSCVWMRRVLCMDEKGTVDVCWVDEKGTVDVSCENMEGGAGAPRSDMQELQFKANEGTDESLESTRRMLSLCEESQDVGVKTLVELDTQGQQLDRIEEGMDQINADMKEAEKNLTGMEKCCGLCVLPCNKSSQFKEDESTWKGKEDGVVSSQPQRVMDDRNGLGASGGYIGRITNDAREDEMEDNMGQVNTMVGNLRNMAIDMGSEIENQNRQVNRINAKNITLVETDTEGNLFHCISRESSNYGRFTEACKNAIIDPATVEKIVEDEPLSDDPIMHLRPQRVSLEMRAGESARIRVRYRHLSNYPLDVYCLMDGSRSMSILKTDLAKLTDDIVDGLQKISTNIQLGFGMFVDKPVLPYTDINMWSGSNCRDCVETFSFKNILAVTDDRKAFQDKVNYTQSSTNVDLPEGTLDALMQVASCPHKVNWRSKGLRVVVVFTDAGFHVAGDGRLAGITTPNDKQCHLDAEGEYTHSKLHDYPSVSELTSVLEDSNLYTTFVVAENLVPLYSMLANQLPRSDCSDLKDNSNNIVTIITEFAQEVISTVELMKPKDIMPEVAVAVTAQCQGKAETTTSNCTGMDPGDEAEFFVNIQIKECPKEGPQSASLNFTLKGYPQSFVLDLKLLCQCECDREEDQGLILNADQCNQKGDLRCGVCVCHEGFLGNKCQCEEGTSGSQIDEKNCIQPNVTNSLVCSGQGKCVCGQCQCNDRQNPNEDITGHYCQCTNFKNCYGANGDICSGNGNCKCDRCECSDAWEGRFCDCQTGTAECQASAEEDICSSHGKCVCNKCACEEGYLGRHCQDCQNCEVNCEEHQFCVQCLVFDTEAACEDICSAYNVTIVSDITKVKMELFRSHCYSIYCNSLWSRFKVATLNCLKVCHNDILKRLLGLPRWCSSFLAFARNGFNLAPTGRLVGEEYGQLCTGTDDDGCRYMYQFKHSKDMILLWAEGQKECPKQIQPWAVVGGVLGAVVLVGLLLLISWRVITYAKDKREYESFEKNRSMAIWSEVSTMQINTVKPLIFGLIGPRSGPSNARIRIMGGLYMGGYVKIKKK
ncbi:Integrin beta-1-B [Chionoecetes opilio]|uniref:Multifunctional fusion protein n=1 Tax=Chionoecetes opilio TaxID=41210 RepID=A0A8J4XSQ1_CHIOP|nr:Integrin beta-1-B [Chionoecetes opilio]